LDSGSLWVTGLQLPVEMLSFKLKLPSLYREWAQRSAGSQLGSIEIISSSICFIDHVVEIEIDIFLWFSRALKALQLGMIGIPTGLTVEHFSGQKSFSPKGNESLYI